jgi:hypothetical protein
VSQKAGVNLASVVAAVAALGLTSGTAIAGQPEVSVGSGCQSVDVYHRELRLEVQGKDLPCPLIRRVVSRACRIRVERRWSCFSFHTPGDYMAWFRTRSLGSPNKPPRIEAKRYPCEKASLRAGWRRGLRGFPTLRQMVADDIIRCGLLDGRSRSFVEEVLGQPDYGSSSSSTPYASYGVGLERTSYFQFDLEYLYVGYSAEGTVQRTFLYQS